MKKKLRFFSALLGVALLGGVVLVASCSKDEDSDADKGQADGKAYCDCLDKAGDDWAECDSKYKEVYLGASSEYQVAFFQTATACLGEDEE